MIFPTILLCRCCCGVQVTCAIVLYCRSSPQIPHGTVLFPPNIYPSQQRFCLTHFSKLNHITGRKSVRARNLKSSLGFARANFWRTRRHVTDKEYQFYSLTAWSNSGMGLGRWKGEGKKIANTQSCQAAEYFNFTSYI